ncbi:leucyl/phenylalanyl-tRNA--protein transferase [Actibacterium mucosum KCTC 23349]|uniref:Leucyl/phenylalanyl-tRNA--protein transferase n=1 Tax=Actibacterium mucosum KCTC 23349 TaxID=1454373 RepID=A0A037ZMM7_9RHOB|nr:leucyl/phenylalanyl-tRNA--protein transferase [Actibacterium mucosum]KAJ56071.1 leucyl/phenylalanyl-tRNA--protein transferase [Actibacterium mucosum KCTC 23349]
MSDELTPQLLLQAYGMGIFPMAESRDSDALFWVDPTDRGVFPLDGFYISRSLRRAILAADYRIAVNSDFEGTMRHCADRPETWINDDIFALYGMLHDMGHAHSLEVWRGDTMIGGVYGVSLGGAFYGESMFSGATNGSKIALAYLVDRLRMGGFALFDTQFITPHLATLGAVEIPRAAFQEELAAALELNGNFNAPATPSPQLLIQRSTQTS